MTESQRLALRRLAVALGAVWASVLAISLFSPDLVSGSEQEHLPVAAFGTWLLGAVATNRLLAVGVQTRSRSGLLDVPAELAAAVTVVWVAAAGVSVFGPELVTGSDPTRLPICALVAPVAATVLTRAASDLFGAVTSPAAAPAGG